MAITVKFFANYRDLMGQSEIAIDTAPELSVADIYTQVLGSKARPELRRVTMFAVNEQYVPADTLVHDGDRVAFIPPVSGG
ncbi:MAG: MoaD/ThiS family protein [candidate division Zixibacteria bacterium]|nr:MoaD/ThiS family protein [candidate division Zixibacteria bacterium]